MRALLGGPQRRQRGRDQLVRRGGSPATARRTPGRASRVASSAASTAGRSMSPSPKGRCRCSPRRMSSTVIGARRGGEARARRRAGSRSPVTRQWPMSSARARPGTRGRRDQSSTVVDEHARAPAPGAACTPLRLGVLDELRDALHAATARRRRADARLRHARPEARPPRLPARRAASIAGAQEASPARAARRLGVTSVGSCLRARVEQEARAGLDDAAQPERVEAPAQRLRPRPGRSGANGSRWWMSRVSATPS